MSVIVEALCFLLCSWWGAGEAHLSQISLEISNGLRYFLTPDPITVVEKWNAPNMVTFCKTMENSLENVSLGNFIV